MGNSGCNSKESLEEDIGIGVWLCRMDLLVCCKEQSHKTVMHLCVCVSIRVQANELRSALGPKGVLLQLALSCSMIHLS